MIFLTVGSSLPFDRLIIAVDELVGPAQLGEVFAQIGDGRYCPRNMEWIRTLTKDQFDQRLAASRFVISHAGIGTIAGAIQLGKPVIVMPRRPEFGEIVNGHQISTAERFGAAGHVLVAWDSQSLRQRLIDVRNFRPVPREARPDAVAYRIGEFLRSL